MMIISRSNFKRFCYVGLLSGALCLGACQTIGTTTQSGIASQRASGGDRLSAVYDNFQSDDKFVVSMLEGAKKAENDDRLQDATIFLAKAYDRDPENDEIAWRYARLLRFNNRSDKAVQLLTPYSVRSNPSENVLREYAAALLGNGDVKTARVVTRDLVANKNADVTSWNVAGVVADADNDPLKAIEYFEKGLSMIDDDNERQKSILLNNMALAKAHAGDGLAANADINKAMTGAQFYPQILKNQEALSKLNAAQNHKSDDVVTDVLPVNNSSIDGGQSDVDQKYINDRAIVDAHVLYMNKNQGQPIGKPTPIIE